MSNVDGRAPPWLCSAPGVGATAAIRRSTFAGRPAAARPAAWNALGRHELHAREMRMCRARGPSCAMSTDALPRGFAPHQLWTPRRRPQPSVDLRREAGPEELGRHEVTRPRDAHVLLVWPRAQAPCPGPLALGHCDRGFARVARGAAWGRGLTAAERMCSRAIKKVKAD